MKNLKITRIVVNKLFGNLVHDISLNEEGLTFIHGPNGCGKTTVLNLLFGVLRKQFQALRPIDFESLEIVYSDSALLKFQKVKRARRSNDLFSEDAYSSDISLFDIVITLTPSKGKSVHKFEYTKQLEQNFRPRGDRRFPLSMIERVVPFLNRVALERWVDTRTGERMSLEMVLERYGDRISPSETVKLPAWLNERLDLTNAGFVKTQRLINIAGATDYRGEKSNEPREVVEIYSRQIKETIAKKLAEAAVQSQARDRSFPTRLIQKQFPKAVPQTELLETYRSTEERAQNLMAAGLLDQADSIPLPNKKFTKMERDVLALYLADFNEKLDTFTDLQKRIEALVEIVGTKLRRKKFTVDRKSGFVFKTTEGGERTLSVTDLSSGEQHQIVLFFELIFASAGINFFLIDEPEISLHVEWQRRFIDDLQKVQKLTGANFIVATHSPQIINNRRDIAVSLDGGVTA